MSDHLNWSITQDLPKVAEADSFFIGREMSDFEVDNLRQSHPARFSNVVAELHRQFSKLLSVCSGCIFVLHHNLNDFDQNTLWNVSYRSVWTELVKCNLAWVGTKCGCITLYVGRLHTSRSVFMSSIGRSDPSKPNGGFSGGSKPSGKPGRFQAVGNAHVKVDLGMICRPSYFSALLRFSMTSTAIRPKMPVIAPIKSHAKKLRPRACAARAVTTAKPIQITIKPIRYSFVSKISAHLKEMRVGVNLKCHLGASSCVWIQLHGVAP